MQKLLHQKFSFTSVLVIIFVSNIKLFTWCIIKQQDILTKTNFSRCLEESRDSTTSRRQSRSTEKGNHKNTVNPYTLFVLFTNKSGLYDRISNIHTYIYQDYPQDKL